jgi:TRAP transporter 4TM/12TM fusion protein
MADDPRTGGAGQAGAGRPLSDEELQDLVAATDTGGRSPAGFSLQVILWVAVAWSLFQIWIASPLPFLVSGITGLPVVLNSTESRAIHLGFAIFLAFLAYPALKRSPRSHIPAQDWVLALVGTFCASYLFWFYDSISQRPANPNMQDIVVACVGMVILLEATRRALGPPLTIIASLFLIYTFFGPYMPSLIAHKGVSLAGVVDHQWTSTSGVYGTALEVSTSFVFLFVLFGALLDKAGAGNYFIKVAFSLLGHYRGGPAKAAVVASAMTGLISGSSIANVVTTGTFTIPMMKRTGLSAEKAGAVEVASSVNGQIMPPVMGAAAFLMVEYVGISYFEVVKHAFIPALISYIALVYIVHLEAVKANMKGLPRAEPPKPFVRVASGILFGFLAISALSMAIYYGLGWVKSWLGDATPWLVAVFLTVVYVGLVRFCAGYPELELDDPRAPVISLPRVGPTVKSGIHFILPVIVLIWCLMVERLSPGLSAFWATAFMIFIVLTQRPLFAFFRGQRDLSPWFGQGLTELFDGLVTGARNMIGIGIATATAGIIVGSVSQTGVGLVLAELVEILSLGNIMLILIWTAVLSLILGMGLPTTANYIVVSALMAPVVVQLGQDAGLIVPLIAVHLFVFYFGIMADVTPPVGLASFAAAAVSGGDPIKTGFVAFFYSLRTAALPFLFIFNTDLLLINVGWLGGLFVFVVATVAMLIFAAATQGFFLARNRAYETVLLLLIAFSLFRPGFWMDLASPPTRDMPPAQIVQVADRMQAGDILRLRVDGLDAVGNPRSFIALLPLGEGASGEERLQSAGLELYVEGDEVLIDNAAFGTPAEAAGLEFDQKIVTVKEPVDQPPKELMYIPALLLLGLIVFMQRGRRNRQLAQATP